MTKTYLSQSSTALSQPVATSSASRERPHPDLARKERGATAFLVLIGFFFVLVSLPCLLYFGGALVTGVHYIFSGKLGEQYAPGEGGVPEKAAPNYYHR